MNLIKRIYEAVIVDDYIEPLTSEFLTAIFSASRRRRRESRPNLHTEGQPDTESSEESIEDIPVTDGDDILHIFSNINREYTLDELNRVQIQLIDKLVKVKKIIVSRSPGYIQSIEECFSRVEEVGEEAEFTKPKVKELKETLQRLEMSRKKSQAIVNLRIKLNNLRSLGVYLEKMPNPNQMKLPQLKRISLQEWLKQLQCYESISRFIQAKTEQAYTEVIESLEIISQRFEDAQYLGIFQKYLDLEIQTPLDDLLLSVLVKQIRTFDLSCVDLATLYATFMRNFLKICLWHKHSSTEFDLRDRMIALRPRIWEIMEQHLSEVVRDSVGLSPMQLYQMGCQMNRLIQMGEGFSGKHVGLIAKQLLDKHTTMYNMSFEKHLHSVTQSLSIEDSSSWSRLPVDNNYRHTSTQTLICNLFNRCEGPVLHQLSVNDFYYLFSARKDNELPNEDETWELPEYRVDRTALEPFKLKKVMASLIELDLNKEVVINQSVLPYLRFYEEMSELLFSLRLVTERILASVFFVTDFYLYFLYTNFTPEDAKRLLKTKPTGPKEIYERAKIHNKYPTLTKFINRFEEDFHKNKFDAKIKFRPSKLDGRIIRSRVVALESFDFISAYLSFCLLNLKRVIPRMEMLWKRVEDRLNVYPLARKELAEFLYSECIYKLTNIEPILSPIERLSWENVPETLVSLQDIKESLSTYLEEFVERIKDNSNGEVPSATIQQIHILFTRFVSRCIQNKFVRISKVTPQGKEALISMFSSLRAGIHTTDNDSDFVEDIIRVIRVSNSPEWEEVRSFIESAVDNCNLSYTGLVLLAKNCRASEEAPKDKREERERMVEEYILKVYQ